MQETFYRNKNRQNRSARLVEPKMPYCPLSLMKVLGVAGALSQQSPVSVQPSKFPAVEVSCLEIEENGVFGWRGGLRVGRLGGRKGGKGEQGKDESETVKARVGGHGEISLQTMRAMMVDYTGKLGGFMN